ncbi:class I SAM-dependent methyltransferase [Novosphingobium mangrovi (ex Huang et al. 2023)]|uniref:Class I SAM-dependent methyltransferase n=1 Tax=Novosphingobium mangrovi (ex Huang et al. 2023) TaxID=2976432 RepID=A0ABT2I3H7_9SPHN|nr:class I SAM-dependent methyltransferase [Novosphingobium mangrovi (ex Huang et al. 2023)]MCT2399361.1 class I SAM-dependent methyltransferase [Novosphingobium mangrovi (ex Huang et al. 2023)]
MASVPTPDHAALMDKVYRGQRHIYDFTRKYYLFGRDRLIRELDCHPGMAVLELGCGTGRNLELIRKAWPGVHCHGLDISSEMLKNARKRLGTEGRLALGDATDFDASALFGREGFDRVVLSYALSMIPGWQACLTRAAAALAPGGSLHVVDFGDCDGMPDLLRRMLDGWLGRFHVSPRRDLPQVAERLAHAHGLRAEVLRGPLGYYQVVRLTR